MDGLTVACVQHRMGIPASREEFESVVRRFLRQAQSKAAQITVFPELVGVMLAPPLVSSFKLGFIKRADQAKQPTASVLQRGVGGISEAAVGAMGGGFRGSVIRLIRKRSDDLRDLYVEVFGNLAKEYGTAIVAGSLYLYDAETDSLRNRSYFFDADGQVLGFQDKFNLAPDERDLASPGDDLTVFDTRFGRFGILIGRDALYPEMGRLMAIRGADLIIGIAASPGAPQANIIRSALALRADENQVYTASCFMLGPNYLGTDNREEYWGQSALMAPISLTAKGDGILVQAGSGRTESLIATTLDMDALQNTRETSRFRPRTDMHLGNLGKVLGDMYRRGLVIEQALDEHRAGPPEPEPRPFTFESAPLSFEPVSASPEDNIVPPPPSVPEAMSLSTPDQDAEE